MTNCENINIKVDLHVHSKYSVKPTNWILKQFSMPESYTQPKQVYETALARGMTHVTITDHNRIGGCLEIADLPNTFISCEITARFPQDQCKVHVLTYDITEAQFAEIHALRKNIYEMMTYLRENDIRHAIAHPIYPVNNKLTQKHIEQLLLMFDLFELSGFRSAEVNDKLKVIIGQLTRQRLEELAEKHCGDIPNPRLDVAGKGFVCGTDDHSGLFIARSYTMSPAKTIQEMLKNPSPNQTCLQNAKPADLAYSIYAIGYQHLDGQFKIDRWAPFDSGLHNVSSFLTMKSHDTAFTMASIPRWFVDKFSARSNDDTKSMLRNIFRSLGRSEEALNPQNVSQLWLQRVSHAINDRSRDIFDYNINQIRKGEFFSIFESIGPIAALYCMSIPYYVAYKVFQDTRIFAESLDINGNPHHQPKVAHFTDTFYDINGVALTLQQIGHWAQRLGFDYRFVTCADRESLIGEKVFSPVATFAMPEYSHLSLSLPPILDLVDYCYDENFTHIHIATPGPVGLAGLIAAKLLRRPLYATYHTAFPQYAGQITDDQTFEQFAWTYMRWFYDMADTIFVPSQAFKQDLIENGIRESKIALMPRGIDTERFKPNGGTPQHQGFRLLYVGRISKEKNLEILGKAFKLLNRPDVSLTVVGDGPYREEFEANMKGLNVDFPGYLQGEDLVNTYCAADLFVFPSTTDTFGNVILEANACGVPTIVTDIGGPQENVRDGETGLIVEGDSIEALKAGIESLLDKDRLAEMKIKARQSSEKRSFESSVRKLWEFYKLPAETVKTS